jgi:hypothetical protein
MGAATTEGGSSFVPTKKLDGISSAEIIICDDRIEVMPRRWGCKVF